MKRSINTVTLWAPIVICAILIAAPTATMDVIFKAVGFIVFVFAVACVLLCMDLYIDSLKRDKK